MKSCSTHIEVQFLTSSFLISVNHTCMMPHIRNECLQNVSCLFKIFLNLLLFKGSYLLKLGRG